MSASLVSGGGASRFSPAISAAEQRYCAWFHELDAWTEYWDIYHPETHGRFYFGDGNGEPGLLRQLLPRDGTPPAFTAWTSRALHGETNGAFASAVRSAGVSPAVIEVDRLLSGLFAKHFGDASDCSVQADYLEATFRFATNTLPPADERNARIADDDPRKPTAGRHMLDGDLMWFAWCLELEAANIVVGMDEDHARRALLLAGVAMGCGANFAWRGHRRTRSEYSPNAETAALLKSRGMQWASDFDAAASEIHALYRIREWGEPD
jgi:hypothetical protein